jgi:choline dehydrogenase-like flavoprotein
MQDTAGLIGSATQGSLPSTYESTLEAGYTQQYNLLLNNLALDTTAAYEILNNNAGGLDVCLMHPLSRGTVQIISDDPFASPGVDPRWLINSFDFDVMIAALQFNQQILNTKPIQALQPTYDIIPENASTETLSALLKSAVSTEYHYSGTCAMMPLDLGGVVDPNLMVYGTDNLRVVDTSIFPLVPASHLQAVVYAVAEKAADIIGGAA